VSISSLVVFTPLQPTGIEIELGRIAEELGGGDFLSRSEFMYGDATHSGIAARFDGKPVTLPVSTEQR